MWFALQEGSSTESQAPDSLHSRGVHPQKRKIEWRRILNANPRSLWEEGAKDGKDVLRAESKE